MNQGDIWTILDEPPNFSLVVGTQNEWLTHIHSTWLYHIHGNGGGIFSTNWYSCIEVGHFVQWGQ